MREAPVAPINAPAVTVSEITEPTAVNEGMELIDQEAVESIYHSHKILLLASWRGADAAKSWSPTRLDAATLVRHRHVRIIRDYGMFDRREAPQFFPEVNRVRRETGTLVAAEDTTAKRGRT